MLFQEARRSALHFLDKSVRCLFLKVDLCCLSSAGMLDILKIFSVVCDLHDPCIASRDCGVLGVPVAFFCRPPVFHASKLKIVKQSFFLKC